MNEPHPRRIPNDTRVKINGGAYFVDKLVGDYYLVTPVWGGAPGRISRDVLEAQNPDALEDVSP